MHGEHRTQMGKKRQLDEVSIYTNTHVYKKFKGEYYAAYDSASSGSELDEETTSYGVQCALYNYYVHAMCTCVRARERVAR